MYIHKRLSFVWDERKSKKNDEERGLPFDRAKDMDFASAFVLEDDRKDYGEHRYIAYGLIDERLCVLCFTMVGGQIRVISLRKANVRERRRYEEEIETPDE